MIIEIAREGMTSFNEVTNIEVTPGRVRVLAPTGEVFNIDLSSASVCVLLGDTWHELDAKVIKDRK